MSAFNDKVNKIRELDATVILKTINSQLRKDLAILILPAIFLSFILTLQHYFKLQEISEMIKLDFLYPEMFHTYLSGISFPVTLVGQLLGSILMYLYLFRVLRLSIGASVQKLRFHFLELILLIFLPYLLMSTLLLVTFSFMTSISNALVSFIAPLFIFIYCRWGIIFGGAILVSSELNVRDLRKVVEVSYVITLGHKNKIFIFWLAISIMTGLLLHIPWIGMLLSILFTNSFIIAVYFELKKIFKINNGITGSIELSKINLKRNIFKELWVIMFLLIIAISLQLIIMLVK